ncbi:hypothetical protein ACFL6N_06950 [Thermodesulfobacteriota bacterium]
MPTKELDIDKIDNVYDELFGSSTVSEEYEDIFGEFVTEVLDTADADIHAVDSSGKQDGPAVLEFLNALPETVLRAELFQPNNHEISLLDEDGSLIDTLPLSGFSCVRASHIPEQFSEPQRPGELEIIETIDGKTFRVEIPVEQSHEILLFGLTTEEDTPWKYLYFPHSNIKYRSLERTLGEILVEKGMISTDVLHKNQESFHKLKDIQIEEVIALTTKMPLAVVKQEAQKALQGNPKGLKIAELLVASGVIKKEHAIKALQTHARWNRLTICQYLIQSKILREDQVYEGLAEKFRISVIDIRQASFSMKLIASFPKELIIKHQILPLSCQNSILNVATTTPEISSLKEILAPYAKQMDVRFSLVLPSQFNIVLRKVYGKS